MSLRECKKKMSKSEGSDNSRINLKDDKALIDQKIKKAKTDTAPIPTEINELKNRHEAANLISIYASVNATSVEKVLKEFRFEIENLRDIVEFAGPRNRKFPARPGRF